MTSFFVMAVLLNIAPGPALVYLASQTMENGLSAGFMTLLGIELGTLCHLCAVLTGLSLFITKSNSGFVFLQMLGAIFFILYGIVSSVRKENSSNRSLPEIYDIGALITPVMRANNFKYKQCYKGLCINLFNPKMLVFYIALLPSLLNPDLEDTSKQVLWYGGIFALVGACVHFILVGLATCGRQRWIIKSNQSATIIFWMQRITNMVFIVFGVGILFILVKRLFFI